MTEYTLEQNDLYLKLARLYLSATPEQHNQGINWYFKAHEIANAIKLQLALEGIHVSLSKIVGVISALSPNNKWERNTDDALTFIREPLLETKVCTYKANRVKALAILGTQGKSSDIYNILGGTKTKSFFRNIKNPKTSLDVTVDMWMFRAAGLKMGHKNYKAISDALTRVAKDTGRDYKPHQIQAVIWGVIRDGSKVEVNHANAS